MPFKKLFLQRTDWTGSGYVRDLQQQIKKKNDDILKFENYFDKSIARNILEIKQNYVNQP